MDVDDLMRELLEDQVRWHNEQMQKHAEHVQAVAHQALHMLAWIEPGERKDRLHELMDEVTKDHDHED